MLAKHPEARYQSAQEFRQAITDAQSSTEKSVFCLACGVVLDETAAFCHLCGAQRGGNRSSAVQCLAVAALLYITVFVLMKNRR